MNQKERIEQRKEAWDAWDRLTTQIETVTKDLDLNGQSSAKIQIFTGRSSGSAIETIWMGSIIAPGHGNERGGIWWLLYRRPIKADQ